jgi:hypothetical protein
MLDGCRVRPQPLYLSLNCVLTWVLPQPLRHTGLSDVPLFPDIPGRLNPVQTLGGSLFSPTAS